MVRRFGLASVVLATVLVGQMWTARGDETVVLAQGQDGYTGTRDTTIYEENTNTNGGGEGLFCGNTANSFARRTLILFDLSSIPANATITGATLRLTVSKTAAGNQTQALHRLTRDWGEGSVDASNNEGGGALPAPGDATWPSNHHTQSLWTMPGGDFEVQASASTSVGGTGTAPRWTGPGLATDVQFWVDHSDQNFGWILIGNETGSQTTKRYSSSEGGSVSQRPQLTVSYVLPIPAVTDWMLGP